MNRRQFLQRTAIAAGGILLPHFPGLAKANYLYLPHRRKEFRTVTCTVSNGSYIDEACTALGSWADNDQGNGVSTQASFDSKETFKFDSGITTGGDIAVRKLDPGSVEALGNTVIVSISVYLETIGTSVHNGMKLMVYRSDSYYLVSLTNAGIYVLHNPGNTYTLYPAAMPVADTWQEWSFAYDLSGGIANAVVDIYLNNVRVVAGAACDYQVATTDGACHLEQWGYTESNRITYVDWFKVGDGFV